MPFPDLATDALQYSKLRTGGGAGGTQMDHSSSKAKGGKNPYRV